MNNRLKTAIGILVSLICLAIIFFWIDLDQLVEALRLANYRYILASLGVSVTWLMVRAMAWRALLQRKATPKIAYGHVFFSINQGYLLNNLLPFRLGEVGRAYLLSRKASLSFWQVLSSILVERMVDLTLAVGLFISTLLFVVGADWALQAALITGAVMAAGLCALYLAARNRAGLQALSQRVTERLPAALAPLGRLANRFLPAFLDGLGVLTDARQFLTALGWLLLNWLQGWFQYHLLMLAFFPQAQPLWSAFTLGTSALGLAAPSSPGGVGVYEFAVMTALAQFIDAPGRAAALAFTAHLIQIALTGLIGAYALARDGESLAGLYRQTRDMKTRGEA